MLSPKWLFFAQFRAWKVAKYAFSRPVWAF